MNAHTTVNQIKKDILKVAFETSEGHIASSFSILDILYVLYDEILEVNPQNLNASNRNRFVLSKGHAALGYYSILGHFGFLRKDEIYTFCQYNSRLGGHPDRNKVPGCEASTGSLGHGLPQAVGMAMGLKIQNISAQVYCLVGDGEINEGSIWESLLLASHHKLNNLCCILDYNHSTDRALDIADITKKFEAFNWDVESIDGHDHAAISMALRAHDRLRPQAIIANTIKGKGLPIMENNPEWHHKSPNQEQLKAFWEELS